MGKAVHLPTSQYLYLILFVFFLCLSRVISLKGICLPLLLKVFYDMKDSKYLFGTSVFFFFLSQPTKICLSFLALTPFPRPKHQTSLLLLCTFSSSPHQGSCYYHLISQGIFSHSSLQGREDTVRTGEARVVESRRWKVREERE